MENVSCLLKIVICEWIEGGWESIEKFFRWVGVRYYGGDLGF